MTDKISKALATVNDLHGDTLRNLDDNIQTVQIDYAEAMEMLWRQSQTIKRLQQENEKLRAALKPFADAAADFIAEKHDMTRAVVALGDLRAAVAALKETGDE